MSEPQYITVFCPRCGQPARVEVAITGIAAVVGDYPVVEFASSPFEHTCADWSKK